MSWSQCDVLGYLSRFLYNSQYDRIDRSTIGECAGCQGMDTQKVILLLKRLMELANGALDIYGPVDALHADLFQYFAGYAISGGRHYMDDMQRSYKAKNAVFEAILPLIFDKHIDIIDNQLLVLLVKTFRGKVDRQLCKSFEIVSLAACLQLEKNIDNWFSEDKTRKQPMKTRKSEWNTLKPQNMLKKFLTFWKFDNSCDDLNIKKELEDYLKFSCQRSSRITYEAFCQVQKVHSLLKFVLSHHYIFNTFEAAEEKSCATGTCSNEKFESFIRLFHDRDQKYLFAKDVVTELKKALNRRNREVELPDDIIELANDRHLDLGRCYIIPYSKYLETLDQLKLKKDEIILVSVEVKRTRHLTVPIISPYGTSVKPLVDIFYEILGVLTIELQVWRRILPHQMKSLRDVILLVFGELFCFEKPNFMLFAQVVRNMGDILRGQLVPLLLESGIPLEDMKPFDEGRKPLTRYLLYEETTKIWRISELLPDIERIVNVVFAKNIDFSGTTLVTRLDLTMMVQQCIAFYFMQKLPRMVHVLGFCKLDADASCVECVPAVERQISIPPGAAASIRNESEFQIKFDHFESENVIHASLIDRDGENREQLVTSDMARSFVLQTLLDCHSACTSAAHDFIQEMNSEEAKKSTYFYMTIEEMHELSSKIQKNYASELNAALKRADVGAEPSEVAKSASNAMNGVADWMKYTNRCVESLTSFAEFAPNRKFYLKIRQLINEQNGLKEGHVNSGELLEVVKIFMDQHAWAVTKSDSARLVHLTESWHSNFGWIFIPIGYALEILKDLPVNPERLIFVPEINDFLWNLVQETLGPETVKPMEKETVPAICTETSNQTSPPQCKLEDSESEDSFPNLLDEDEEYYMKNDSDLGKCQSSEDASKVEELVQEVENLQQVSTDQVEPDIESFEEEERKKLDRVFEMMKQEVEALKVSMNQAALENEEEKNKLKKTLKLKNGENDKLRQELASRPSSFKNDPIVVKLIASKDERIKALEQELREKKIENIDLKSESKVLNQSIQSKHSELRKNIEYSERLKRELAELQGQINDAKNTADARTIAMAQRNDRLAAEVRNLKSQLQLEKVKNDNFERILAENVAQPPPPPPLQNLNLNPNVPGPSTSESSSTPPPPTPHNQAEKPPECIICHNEMKKKTKITKCESCKKGQWHTQCINEWLTYNPTCPMCRGSFPHPEQFPPLSSTRN